MTEINNTDPIQLTAMDESVIIDYLKDNTDLLERHPGVMTQLTFAHESGAAISLVERQLKLLREENKDLKVKLSNLVYIARENEELSQRFHRLSLELMGAEQLHDIVAMARDQIQTFFYTDYVSFCFHDRLADQLKGLENNTLDPDNTNTARIRDWIHQRKPVFGPLDAGVKKLLFTPHFPMASCALIPLYHTNDIGLMVLGSKSKERFNDGMGTVFLTQLGDLISSKLNNYLS